MTRYCPNCGTAAADGQSFCAKCGAMVPVPEQPAYQPGYTSNPQPAYNPQPSYNTNPQPSYQPAYTPEPQAVYPGDPQFGVPAAPQPPKKNNKGLLIGLAIAAVAVVLVVVFLLIPRLDSVTLDETKLEINVGDKVTLGYKLNPGDYEPNKVTWESSDEDVATVKKGKITAVGIGNCTITVNVDGKTDTCKVEVMGIEKLSLSESSVTIYPEESKEINYTIAPAAYKAKDVSWSSSNEKVATVKNGKITGVSEGSCVITLNVDGTEVTCKVTVEIPYEISLLAGDWDLTYYSTTGSQNLQSAYYFGWVLTLNTDGTGYLDTNDGDGIYVTWSYQEYDDGSYFYKVFLNGTEYLGGYTDGNLFIIRGDLGMVFSR